MSTKAEGFLRRWCKLDRLRNPLRAWPLATIAILLVAQDAFGQSEPAVDRLLKPQKLVVEIFHEPGVPRLEVEKVINGTSVSLASLFAAGGIQIEFAYRDVAIPKGGDYKRVQQLQTPSTPSAWYAAIVVAEEDKGGDGILSLMPDSEGRRTAIVYAKPHREMGGEAPGMFLSAAHELTHILNLHHGDWEGTSFTKDSTIEGYSDAKTTRWHLSAASVKHLRHAPDEFVRPGGVAFGVVLAEHSAHHQPTPTETFTVVNSLADIGKRPAVATRVIRPRSLGPVILILSELSDEHTTTRETVKVSLAVEAKDGSLQEIRVTVTAAGSQRELRSLTAPNPDRQNLDLSVPLSPGTNVVTVSAKDEDGHTTEQELTLIREDTPSKLLAVIFGVEKYTNVRPLKHTLNDARGMRDLLLGLGLEKDRMFYKEDPNLTTVRTGLGTWLRQQAGPKDVAVVYFAGHGAAEIDADSKEKDKLSKYLLPVEADLADLYATALPMAEIADLLPKIKARTLIVILDACFSGSAGGRAVVAESNRADSVITRDFLERGTGQGRVILSASGANEAAQEVEELGHGVFTFYLLKGWSGEADSQKDGRVDLLELVHWVSDQVRSKTGGKQTPGIWGEVREPPIIWRREIVK